MVLSITRYQQLHRRPPTWADAVAGIDPACSPRSTRSPTVGRYNPALWRRELRQHLMTELRRTRWITYTPTPRSLQPGDQGRGWLRTTTPEPPRRHGHRTTSRRPACPCPAFGNARVTRPSTSPNTRVNRSGPAPPPPGPPTPEVVLYF